MRYEHPVFGPDRPRAAVAAIYAYRSALAAYGSYGWHDDTDRTSRRLRERLTEARTHREMYAEYGDMFRGH